MSKRIIKVSLCFLVLAGVWSNAVAQRSSKKRNQQNQQPTSGEQQVNNNTAAPSYDPSQSIPLTYDTTAPDNTLGKPSLRNDNAFDKGSLTQRTPLPYEHLRWDDALYAEKVWRELDLREKMNSVFRYEATDDNGSQLFIDILLKAVKNGEITAFSDERFTTPMTADEVNQQTAGGYDTADKKDINDPSKIVARVVTLRTFDSKSVQKIRLKEEWVFDRESSRLFCRILGIAPVLTRYSDNGQERGSTVLFWVYYPDARAVLAKYEVYNPKNMGQNRMTWEELFESRMFSSYILKSTIDNPSNRPIRTYIKSSGPENVLALLEGENIKEKIFNYEQDLWSY